MSDIYEYDLTIVCTREDKASAQILGRKLLKLDFLPWFDLPEGEEEGLFIERFRQALNNSAVCVLLVGAGGRGPWADDFAWAAINSRLERTRGEFRLIMVMLPGAHARPARTMADLMMTRLIDYRHRCIVLCFKESLDEEDVMHELVLGIRGVDLDDDGDWFWRAFREDIRLRAQNALSVDWHQLASDLHTASFNTSARRDGTPPLGLNAGKVPEDTRGQQHIKQITTFPQRSYGVGQSPARRLPSEEALPPLYARILNHGPQMVAGMLMLLAAVAFGYSWRSHLAARNGREVPPSSPRINVAEMQNATSAQSNSASVTTNPTINERLALRELSTAPGGKQTQAQSSPGKRKRGDGTPATASSTQSLVPIPSTGSALPLTLPTAGIGKEESLRAEIPNALKERRRAKLARMKRIYVDFSNIALSEDEQAEFIKNLRENDVVVSTKKEDMFNANGIAKLQFGPKQWARGIISVELQDKKQDHVSSWHATAVSGNASKESMQQLGRKMGSTIREVSAEVNRHRPISSHSSVMVSQGSVDLP